MQLSGKALAKHMQDSRFDPQLHKQNKIKDEVTKFHTGHVTVFCHTASSWMSEFFNCICVTPGTTVLNLSLYI
jgi:hypothetical protein